jgi:hypothetical protein
MLALIFENVKLTGVTDAKVVGVEFVDDSHAILTFSSHEGIVYCSLIAWSEFSSLLGDV